MVIICNKYFVMTTCPTLLNCVFKSNVNNSQLDKNLILSNWLACSRTVTTSPCNLNLFIVTAPRITSCREFQSEAGL